MEEEITSAQELKELFEKLMQDDVYTDSIKSKRIFAGGLMLGGILLIMEAGLQDYVIYVNALVGIIFLVMGYMNLMAFSKIRRNNTRLQVPQQGASQEPAPQPAIPKEKAEKTEKKPKKEKDADVEIIGLDRMQQKNEKKPPKKDEFDDEDE